METALARPTSIVDRLSQLVESNEIELPPYPEVALRVQRALERDDTSAKQVAEMLADEPALTAQVLRIANSAAYGGLHRVSDIGQGVARLGLRQIASLVTALTLKQQFATDDPRRRALLQALWDHAVATALAARFLAERIGADAEQAFLAGLLHDTGKLLVVRGVDVLQASGEAAAVTPAMLDELMTELHTKLGHAALIAWNLPVDLARIALHHHDSTIDSSDIVMLCVQAANLVSRKAGFHPYPDPGLQLLHEPPIEMLGLRDLSIASLVIDLEDELEKKHRLFAV